MADTRNPYKPIELDSIAGGATPELFGAALREVHKNIVDLNTVATAKRSITLTFTFSPKEDPQTGMRRMGEVTVQVGYKLAPIAGHSGYVFFTRDGILGNPVEQMDLTDPAVTDISEAADKKAAGGEG